MITITFNTGRAWPTWAVEVVAKYRGLPHMRILSARLRHSRTSVILRALVDRGDGVWREMEFVA